MSVSTMKSRCGSPALAAPSNIASFISSMRTRKQGDGSLSAVGHGMIDVNSSLPKWLPITASMLGQNMPYTRIPVPCNAVASEAIEAAINGEG